MADCGIFNSPPNLFAKQLELPVRTKKPSKKSNFYYYSFWWCPNTWWRKKNYMENINCFLIKKEYFYCIKYILGHHQWMFKDNCFSFNKYIIVLPNIDYIIWKVLVSPHDRIYFSRPFALNQINLQLCGRYLISWIKSFFQSNIFFSSCMALIT